MKAKRSNPLLSVLRRFSSTTAIVISFIGAAQAANENRYWDGGTANIGTNGDGASGGTTGNWNTTLTNWDAGAVAHVAWVNGNNDYAIFGGTAGTVTLTSAVTANSLTFATTGYTLAGTSALTFAGGGASITTSSIAASGTTTISAPIAGTPTGGVLTIAANGDLTNTGGGSAGLGLVFSGTNTFTANIKVTSGLFTPGTADANLGNAANTITLDGGGLLANVSKTISRAISVTSNNGYARAYGGQTLTLSGVLSGSGVLTKTDTGTLAITNASNTRTGTTALGGGSLSIATANGLGTGALNITSTAGGTFTVANNNATTVANAMILPAPVSAQTYTLTKNSASASTGTELTWSGNITGGGANTTLRLTTSSASDWTTTCRLTGSNTFTGKVEIYRGSLVLTDPANLGASSNTLVFNANVSSLGDLRFANSMTLPNPVSLLWPATISTQGNNATLSGVISGANATYTLSKLGAGTLTMAADNTYVSPTSVNAGTLKLDYTTNAGSKLADAAALTFAGGTLDLAGTNITPHVELVASTVVAANSGLTRTGATANQIALGAISSTGGTLDIAANSIATTSNALTNGLLPTYITVGGAPATTNGSNEIIAASGIVDVNRLGGTIASSAGTNVRIIEAGTTGDVTMAASGVTDIATLFNAGTAAPTVVDIGSGNKLRLAAAGSITAGTNGLSLSNGTLTAGGADDTAGVVEFFNASANASTINSTIADNGSGIVGLSKVGSGVLVLGGTNTHTGTTTVNAGTLALAGGSAIPDTGVITLNNSGVLRLDNNETIAGLTGGASSGINLQANALTWGDTASDTYPGVITGTGGSLVKAGTGTVTLTGANTYTGGTTVNDGILATTLTTTQNSLGTGMVSIGGTGTVQVNNTNVSGSTPVIANTFTGTGLLKMVIAANTTARNTTMNNVTGFNGTIQLSNLGTNGDKWNVNGIGTVPAALVIDSGSQFYLNTNPASFSGGITVSGTGNSETRGAIRLGATTLGGNITLAGDATFGPEGTAVFAGNVTSGAAVPVTLTVGTTNATGNSVFNGAISDGASSVVSVVKATGTGTMTLAGTNTYTGPTTLTTGTLSVTGSSANSALTMAAGTTLRGEGTVASLTTSGASNLFIDPTTTQAFTSSAAVTLGGVVTVDFAVPATSSGLIRVLNYTGADPATANFTLVNASSYRSAVFTAGSGAVDLNIGNSNLVWTGAGGTNWDVKTTTNWSSTPYPTTTASNFAFGDSVTFGEGPSGDQTVNLSTSVQPASITFSNTTTKYTVSGTGAIAGTTGISKTGTGIAELGGTNTYTGSVSITGGVLKALSTTALGATSAGTTVNGGTLDANALALSSGETITIQGTGVSGMAAIYNSSTTTGASVGPVTLSGAATIGSAVPGADTAKMLATGTATLNGNKLTLSGGAVSIGLQNITSGDIDILSGATLYSGNGGSLTSATGTITVFTGGLWEGRDSNNTTMTSVHDIVLSGGKMGNGTITGNNGGGGGVLIKNNVQVASGGGIMDGVSSGFGIRIRLTGALTGSGPLTIQGGSGVELRGDVSGYSGTFTVLTNLVFDGTAAQSLNTTVTESGAGARSFQQRGAYPLNLGGSNIGITNFQIGRSAGSEVIIPSGTTVTTKFIDVGTFAGGYSGTVSQTGGTVTAASGGNGVRIGHYNTGAPGSFYNLSGGTLDASGLAANATASAKVVNIGWDGLGTVNVSGTGTLKAYGIQLDANGDSPSYNNSLVISSGGTVESGAGNIAGASVNDKVFFNGGTLKATADSTWSAAMTANSSTTTALDTNGFNVAATGLIDGAGALSKATAGTLTLSSGGAYSGTATVTGGTLHLGTAAWTAATFATGTGGTLRPATAAAAGTSTVNALNLNGGAVTFRVAYTGADKIVVTGTDTFSVASGTVVNVIPSGDLFSGDRIPLINYNGTIGGAGLAGFVPPTLPNPHYAVSIEAGSSLNDGEDDSMVVLAVGAASSITWAGTVNGNWDEGAAGTSNWKLDSDSSDTKFYNQDAVRFDDAGLTPGDDVVTLVGTIAPNSVAVLNSDDTYTFQGAPITGLIGITKTQAGTLVLANNNTYTGVTTVNGGTVRIGAGSTTGSVAGDIAIGTGAKVEFSRSDTVTYAGKITGAGSLVKLGPNTLVLDNDDNTFTGGLIVEEGRVELAGPFLWSSAGMPQGKGPVLVKSGAVLANTQTHAFGGDGVPTSDLTLELNAQFQTVNGTYVRDITMTGASINPGSGSGNITCYYWGGTDINVLASTTQSVISSNIAVASGPNRFNIADEASVADDLLVSGKFTGNGAYIKTGAGTMNLTGDNTGFSGANAGFDVRGGTLKLASLATQLGGGYLALKGGALEYTGTGAETFTNPLWIDAGGVTAPASATFNIVDSGAAVTFNPSAGTVNQPVIKSGAGGLALQSVISGTATVTVNAGKLTLGGTNTYSGVTVVNAGGTLAVDGDSIANTGRLDINGTGMVEVTEPVDPVIEVVDTLYIDGVQKGAGTYGATGSGATFIDNAHFAGAGVVQVVTGPPDGYNAWASAYGLSGGDALRASDPDGDGFTNLQEFLFGKDPTINNGALTSTERTANGLVIRWAQRTGTSAAYSLLESATLANPWTVWVSPGAPHIIENDGAQTGDSTHGFYQPKKATVPVDESKNFFRVEGVEN